MDEEIARKLGDIQVWLTDHEARLDAYISAIEDHTTRIITLEETVAGLIIPRRLPYGSSPHEYKIYAEPVVGTPLTVQVKAETDREAIEKAEKMFNTPLAKTEILSKHATKKSSSPEPSRWVLEMYPLDVLAWRRSLVELAGKPLTPSEHRLVSSYDDYLRRRGYLTSRQIEVLGEIARRHEVELPAVPEVVVR